MDIVEVAPRDGLQNDPAHLSTAQKVELIRRCAATGARRIEVASFVHPTRVPQMADAEAVLAEIADDAEIATIGLVLNERGMERAAGTAVGEVNVVVVSTDTFSERNSGMSTDQAVAMAGRVVARAHEVGRRASVTLAASFGCPFEGEVPIGRTRDLVGQLADAGVDEIALADTIGVAVPADVRARVQAVRGVVTDGVTLRAHFHNTRNTGYANALAAYESGVTALDASLGGIGGCPFAPRATGNIATEDLVYALERSGVDTGYDLDALMAAAEWLSALLARPVPGLLSRAGAFPS